MEVIYIIENDFLNPERNGQEFKIHFEYEAHKHIYKYFAPVSKWANGAIIKEK